MSDVSTAIGLANVNRPKLTRRKKKVMMREENIVKDKKAWRGGKMEDERTGGVL